jgi:L-fuculose-phosphate aldolase
MLETCCDILIDAYKRNWITSRDGNIERLEHICKIVLASGKY